MSLYLSENKIIPKSLNTKNLKSLAEHLTKNEGQLRGVPDSKSSQQLFYI